jgi:hypothetical protein
VSSALPSGSVELTGRIPFIFFSVLVMKIKEWLSVKNQMSQIGRHHWDVSRLIQLSKDLPVFEAQLDCINVWKKYDVSMREMVMHMKAILDADLKYPIILDEDGEIMDGRHRIMKAMPLGLNTIKAVRFQENPPPCKISD